ncbi:MAG: response regulator, partial [Chloroflexi bacterium]|nr:response regulator [Chloroflexota bacterium]
MNGAAQPARVLVVDDDPDMLLVIEAALSDEGLQVQTAADGPSAIDLMQLRPPDLLILDVTLPSMDSSSVAERMRELRGDA